MALAILLRLTLDETPSRDLASDEVGVLKIQSGIENGHVEFLAR